MIDASSEKRRRGRKREDGNESATESEQEELLTQMYRVSFSLGYLCAELRRILDKVVTSPGPHPRLLSYQQRLEELQTILQLLREVAQSAPSLLKKECQAIVKQLQYALPCFVHTAWLMEPVQQQAIQQAGEEAVGLMAWAWRHRDVLGSCDQLLQGLPASWRDVSASLFALWDQAVRASSVVENWHSILRPYLAVHRRLSAGMLALLAVWHNHRVAPRGLHEGLSSLQRSGCQTAAQDWLEALGYPSAA